MNTQFVFDSTSRIWINSLQCGRADTVIDLPQRWLGVVQHCIMYYCYCSWRISILMFTRVSITWSVSLLSLDLFFWPTWRMQPLWCGTGLLLWLCTVFFTDKRKLLPKQFHHGQDCSFSQQWLPCCHSYTGGGSIIPIADESLLSKTPKGNLDIYLLDLICKSSVPYPLYNTFKTWSINTGQEIDGMGNKTSNSLQSMEDFTPNPVPWDCTLIEKKEARE